MLLVAGGVVALGVAMFLADDVLPAMRLEAGLLAQNKDLSSIGADLIREGDTEAQATKQGLAGGGPDNRRPSQARAGRRP
ncbi:hypothetical protein [Streptomyces sp. NPDC056105]|uniref:hypothetical protein n=1 Tax=Streptomyces sp. NPDC056105 TaxID=3345714 RepID=UPI0035DF91D4